MRNNQGKLLVFCIGLFFFLFPVDLRADKSSQSCEIQGGGAEKDFAEKVCKAAQNLGIHPTLIHSYGAGGVDVFISESEAENLRMDPAKLTCLVTSLTDWAKRNYHAFNAVDVTIVGGDLKIAQGSKLGEKETKVILFQTTN